MVKDNVITMENGQSYYIIEDVEYKGKKYVLSVECNLDLDIVNEDDYLIMELQLIDNDLVIKNVNDIEIAKIVSNMLLSKVAND